MQDPIEQLLTSACAGDEQAFVALVRRSEPGLRAAVQARLPHRWQALLSPEDVLQHTYLEAILQIRTFSPRGLAAFDAWIRKLAEYHLIEVIRALEADKRGGKLRSVRQASPAESFAELFDQLSGLPTQTTPSGRIQRAEENEALQRALQRLPEHYRLIVQRYDLQRVPIAAIATEVGRSAGAIHLIRLRAHAQLRDILQGQLTVFQKSP